MEARSWVKTDCLWKQGRGLKRTVFMEARSWVKTDCLWKQGRGLKRTVCGSNRAADQGMGCCSVLLLLSRLLTWVFSRVTSPSCPLFHLVFCLFLLLLDASVFFPFLLLFLVPRVLFLLLSAVGYRECRITFFSVRNPDLSNYPPPFFFPWNKPAFPDYSTSLWLW